MTRLLPQILSSTIEQFTGRIWVLVPLLKWLDETPDRFFILRGKPGSGKSMLLGWLSGSGPAPEDADDRSQMERFRAYTKSGAIHFCRFSAIPYMIMVNLWHGKQSPLPLSCSPFAQHLARSAKHESG